MYVQTTNWNTWKKQKGDKRMNERRKKRERAMWHFTNATIIIIMGNYWMIDKRMVCSLGFKFSMCITSRTCLENGGFFRCSLKMSNTNKDKLTAHQRVAGGVL